MHKYPLRTQMIIAKSIVKETNIPYAHYKNSDLFNELLPDNGLNELERNNLFNICKRARTWGVKKWINYCYLHNHWLPPVESRKKYDHYHIECKKIYRKGGTNGKI